MKGIVSVGAVQIVYNRNNEEVFRIAAVIMQVSFDHNRTTIILVSYS